VLRHPVGGAMVSLEAGLGDEWERWPGQR
jgi:hypothetical protein